MTSDLQRINNVCLVILASVATTMGLIYFRTILVPLVFSLFIYTVLAPALKILRDHGKFPQWLAISVTLLALVFCAFVFVVFLSISINDFVRSFDVYNEKFLILMEDIFSVVQSYGIQIDLEWLRAEISRLPFFSLAKGITGGVVSFIGNFSLIGLFVMFLLLGQNYRSSEENPLIHEIQLKVSQYLITKSLISLVTAVVTLIILLSFGVELAVMFTVLTFLLNFIPNIGSIVAVFAPMPVIVLQFGWSWEVLVLLGLLGAAQFVIGNIAEPKLLGDSMNLHPVTVMAFLIFWGLVWGIPGMFLAVPITAIFRIVLSRIETTRPVAELLGGRFVIGKS